MTGKSLANKNLVIIVGTKGLGLSAAKAFVENGANVVVVGRNGDSAQQAKNILGGNALSMVGNAIEPATAIQAISGST